MAQLDVPPVHLPTPSPFLPAPSLRLARLCGQRTAVASAPAALAGEQSLARLREEVALLTSLVRDQHRLLAQLAEHIGRRLEALERLVEARSVPPPPAPISRYDLPGRPAAGPARDAVVRRHGLGRGLDALIPTRDP